MRSATRCSKPILLSLVSALALACGSSSSSTPEIERPAAVGPAESSIPPISPWPEVVHTYTNQFYAGEFAALFSRFTEQMKTEVPIDRLQQMQEEVLARFGRQIDVLGEDTRTKDPYRGFVRWARFDKFDGVVELQWILREDDLIAGFFIRPSQGGMSG